MTPFTSSQVKKISVFGAGSWGTALAMYLARQGYKVQLWHNVEKDVLEMNAVRENKVFMPGIPFPENMSCISDLSQAVSSADLLLVVVPSKVFGLVLQQIKPHLKKHQPVLWATKGVDDKTNQLLDVLAEETFGKDAILGVLSGPTFAIEVAQGLFTATTLACHDAIVLPELVKVFASDIFQVDATTDVTGAEIGGFVKNVIAIAVGVCDGLGLGANARAALMTRGLNEMMALGKAVGALPETVMGLAGAGDLILTCTDNKSRNRRFGLLLGEGKSSGEALKMIGQVVEGYANVKEVEALAARYQVHMPIVEEVSRLCHGGRTEKQRWFKII